MVPIKVLTDFLWIVLCKNSIKVLTDFFYGQGCALKVVTDFMMDSGAI